MDAFYDIKRNGRYLTVTRAASKDSKITLDLFSMQVLPRMHFRDSPEADPRLATSADIASGVYNGCQSHKVPRKVCSILYTKTKELVEEAWTETQTQKGDELSDA